MVLMFLKRSILILLLLSSLHFSASSNAVADEVLREKKELVAMRMIGHEVLLCLGDNTSRVLPIRKEEGRYVISFENEFGFDPDDIATTIQKVMKENDICIVK